MSDPTAHGVAYDVAYQQALTDPSAFWAEAASALHWDRPWDRVLDDRAAPLYRWFEGGMLNTCFNAIDRHVIAGRGAQAAVIYDSPVTATKRVITYAELQDEVARCAGALRALGVERGDRVIIYMPMTPETLIGMYACARIGAVHSVVFGGFAPNELAVRIDDAEPKVILTASCGIEVQRIVPYKPLLDQALAIATHQPDHCIVLQREVHPCELTAGRDHDWHVTVGAADAVPCVSVAATDPLYILYTSGTTGKPKGVVRDHGGHAVALHWSIRHVFGMSPGEVFWAASDFGWAVGHSYIVYAPLLAGCTTVVHEGKPVGTPDAGEFWRVIQEHNVRVLFTAPTAFRAIKRDDPDGTHHTRYDTSCLRTLFLAGERLDPDTYHWARALLQTPVVDNWWQTETGWPVAANCMGLTVFPVKPGSPTKPVPGYVVEILDDDGHALPPNREGAVTIRLPLPPGTLPTLWRDDARYIDTYLTRYPGYYLTGDGGYIDEDGYLFIMGRVDDIIIVAGHNLSSGAMEQALAGHPDVAECAVIGVRDALKTQLPVGLVVLKSGVAREQATVTAELVQRVRDQVGPVANFRMVAIVPRLPKTRSGKVLRKTMRAIADGDPWTTPATIDDPAILGEITQVLQTLGLARNPGVPIGG
ncbi:MAG TPA: propionyl-CoA synthetase [Gemmatimonas sp.]|uniref:propionyl-CoA synthetase n=1 Tax=Gemmatimonas sp. TaxID=1962908 RepID=UPI002EDB2C2F